MQSRLELQVYSLVLLSRHFALGKKRETAGAEHTLKMNKGEPRV
jgi:hypothetical protein